MESDPKRHMSWYRKGKKSVTHTSHNMISGRFFETFINSRGVGFAGITTSLDSLRRFCAS